MIYCDYDMAVYYADIDYLAVNQTLSYDESTPYTISIVNNTCYCLHYEMMVTFQFIEFLSQGSIVRLEKN